MAQKTLQEEKDQILEGLVAVWSHTENSVS